MCYPFTALLLFIIPSAGASWFRMGENVWTQETAAAAPAVEEPQQQEHNYYKQLCNDVEQSKFRGNISSST